MDMLLRAHGLDTLEYGMRVCPIVKANRKPDDQTEKLNSDDARAASLIICLLSRNIAKIILTCRHAYEIRNKLLTRF